jgi:transglutaminase-like putative cysteine protease
MTALNVRHTTVYRYRRPVRFGDHRLMLRPCDSHDLRLIRTNLNFLPAASVRWIHDVFGNSIAIASFAESAAELRIENELQLETYAVERPRSEIAPEAASYPFIYSADDRIDLGRMLERHHPDPTDRLCAWARGFVRGSRTGTQTPVETLDRGSGSCRDLAMLLIEAARYLGFGARVVTGYLYNPSADSGDTADANIGADPCMGRHLPSGSRLDRLRSDKRDDQRRQPDPGRRHPGHQPSSSHRRQFCRWGRRLSRHDRRCGGDLGPRRRGAFGVIILRCMIE